jgi:hypothetical protein
MAIVMRFSTVLTPGADRAARSVHLAPPRSGPCP